MLKQFEPELYGIVAYLAFTVTLYAMLSYLGVLK